MAVQVIIPAPLRKYTDDRASVEAEGQTIGQVIDGLEEKYPGIKSRITEPDGEIKHFVNVFLNEEDVREKQGIETPVSSGDEVAIIPAIAGGSEMASTRVKLSFEKERAKDPVIWEMGRKFDVVTNIRRADIEWDYGWVILQIDGPQEEIDKALAYARETGVRVDPVEGTVVE